MFPLALHVRLTVEAETWGPTLCRPSPFPPNKAVGGLYPRDHSAISHRSRDRGTYFCCRPHCSLMAPTGLLSRGEKEELCSSPCPTLTATGGAQPSPCWTIHRVLSLVSIKDWSLV